MNKEIVIRSINSAVDFAVLHDGKLIELHKEKDNNKFNVGDIFIAKLKRQSLVLMQHLLMLVMKKMLSCIIMI